MGALDANSGVSLQGFDSYNDHDDTIFGSSLAGESDGLWCPSLLSADLWSEGNTHARVPYTSEWCQLLDNNAYPSTPSCRTISDSSSVPAEFMVCNEPCRPVFQEVRLNEETQSVLALSSRRTGYRPAKRSSCSISDDTTSDRNQSKARFHCSECDHDFEYSRDLDRHGSASNHKPYRCLLCPKSYARRDVYLRHKMTHQDGRHSCKCCAKVFKRKDHYLQHMKRCHPSEAAQSIHDPGFGKIVDSICAGSDAECAFSDDKYAKEQKEKMRKVVQSIGDLLGDRNPTLLGRLENTVESMNGMNVEQVAESMAGVAVLHAGLDAVKGRDGQSSSRRATSW